MSTSKLQYEDIMANLTNLSDVAKYKYNSHAFEAGYLQSMLSSIIANKLPLKDQLEAIKQIQDTVYSLQQGL
jgi:hypothetical protein